jgi:hypothetical protein
VKRKAGDVLGDYVLAVRVGAGPASELWKAVHRDDPRRASAVRFFADGRGVPPLRVKADVLRALDHPNITRVEEVDMAAREPYLRREWVEGASLAGRALRPSEARDVAAQALRALIFAHGRGVVHGRLGPADILVGADGRVRLSDFGLDGSASDPKEDLRALGEALAAAGDPFAARLAAGEFDAAERALKALEALPAPAVGRPKMPSWIAGPILIVGVFLVAYVALGMTFVGLQPSLRLIVGAAGAGLCAAAWRHVHRPLEAAVFWGALLWGYSARTWLPFMAGAGGIALLSGVLWLRRPAATPKA